MSQFDFIKIEALIGSSWVNLTPDVVGVVRGSFGILGSTFMDRVGDVGKLEFQLDNSAANSAGKIGYYSPEHANAMSGWTTGLTILLTWQYDGKVQRKRYYIDHNGIKITPGTQGDRRVTVTCHDWIGYAARHVLNLLQSASNKQIDQAVPLVLANMAKQPQATAYTSGATVFPTVFDIVSSETTALGEFNRLAMSEWGKIYIERNPVNGETLFVNSRASRGNDPYPVGFPKHSSECGLFLLAGGSSGYLLKTDGGRIILNEYIATPSFSDADYEADRMSEIVHGSQLVNQISITAYPRKVDTSVSVLWKMESSISIAPGETKSGIRGRYRDPNGQSENINGTDFVTPVATTDYQAFSNPDGTGTNLTANLSVTATFGAAEVELSLTNTGATTLYTGKDILFQVRGKRVVVYDKTEQVVSDSDSIAKYGKHELTFDMKYEDDPVNPHKLATSLLMVHDYKSPHTFIESVWLQANRSHKNMVTFMFARTDDIMTFQDAMSGTNRQYIINGMEFEIHPGNIVYYKLILTNYFVVVDF